MNPVMIACLISIPFLLSLSICFLFRFAKLLFDGLQYFVGHAVAMLIFGEFAVEHFLTILDEGLANQLVEIGILLGKLGSERFKHTQHIVGDEQLATATRTSTYADGWYTQFLGNVSRQLSRDSLKDDTECPSFLQRHCFAHDFASGLNGLS